LRKHSTTSKKQVEAKNDVDVAIDKESRRGFSQTSTTKKVRVGIGGSSSFGRWATWILLSAVPYFFSYAAMRGWDGM
jgi:hypothetical protein